MFSINIDAHDVEAKILALTGVSKYRGSRRWEKSPTRYCSPDHFWGVKALVKRLCELKEKGAT
jgi:hypothetical protein